MADIFEIKSLIVEQGDAMATFRDKHASELKALAGDVAQLQMRGNRPGATGGFTGGDTKALHEAVRQALATGDDTELKAMSVGSDPDGGYLTIGMLDNQVRTIREAVSPMSTLAREIIVSEGSAIELPFVRGTLTSAWVGEMATRPETAAVPVGTNRIELHELYAMPQVTQRLLDDSRYDIGALLVDQIAHGLARAEDLAFHSGDGVARPRGFTTHDTAATADATREWGTIQHIATGASGAFHTTGADPLFDVVGALQPQYRTNATWLMSRGTHATLRKLRTAADGQYLLQPGLAAGEPDRLLGYPVVISEAIPAIAANSLSIWFGDFREAYCVARRPGLKLLRDPYTTKGRVNFYAYARVGGGLVNSESIKALKFATT